MNWSNPAFSLLADLLSARTGLVFSADRRASVELGIRRAMARSREMDPDLYFRQVARDAALFDDLIVELTIGETYFFREPGQFEFIRSVALPEVRRIRGFDHAIRVWSAGCASGEEAYSLAMLLDREGLAGPIPVLATDISRAALAKARRAVYSDWSLRGEDSAAAARPYLRTEGGRHVVVESIRHRVAFEYLNLALDIYPSFATGTFGIDLILCRNVMIYLDPETVRAVARRFFAALGAGGWLITASSDPPLAGLAPFEVVVAEQGIFYRQGAAKTVATGTYPDLGLGSEPLSTVGLPGGDDFPIAVPTNGLPPSRPVEEGWDGGLAGRLQGSLPSLTPGDLPSRPFLIRKKGDKRAILSEPSPATRRGIGIEEVLAAAREDLARGDYDRAAARTEGLGRNPDAAATHVRALANLDPGRAEEACAAAVKLHPFSAELHHLRSVLLVSLGRDAEAAREARRVIYLDRSLAIAHFLLGSILCRGGDNPGAWRAFRNARDLCAARPADEVVALSDGEPAGRLADTAIRQMARLVAPVEAAP